MRVNLPFTSVVVVGRGNVSVEIAEQIVELGHQISDYHRTIARRKVVTRLGTFHRVRRVPGYRPAFVRLNCIPTHRATNMTRHHARVRTYDDIRFGTKWLILDLVPRLPFVFFNRVPHTRAHAFVRPGQQTFTLESFPLTAVIDPTPPLARVPQPFRPCNTALARNGPFTRIRDGRTTYVLVEFRRYWERRRCQNWKTYFA